MLSACSGGSGGALVSTPTPPASYTKIADMTGDRTFQTGGIQYNSAPSGFSNTSTFAFGNGVTVAYTAASDSYKLTAPDGSTVTFDPSNIQAPPAGSTTQVWAKTAGTIHDQFSLSVPTVSGVPLSYTLTGSWQHFDTATNTALVRLAVGGAPTIASDMPKTGTATYSTTVGGAANMPGGATPSYLLTGNSTATFSANFGTGAISTTLTLAGTQPSTGATVTNFGTFTGTGSIGSGGPGFTGTLAGTGANGVFSGAFFGPQALEMGYDWSLNGGSFTAVGAVTGRKN
ncbi:hypothetical protein GCM10009087_21070 [Sphingomonas oligophenolica]